MRRAVTCSGSTKSNSSPASDNRLINPETSSVDTITARIRKSRLLAEAIAATPTSSMTRANTSPPCVTERRETRAATERNFCQTLCTVVSIMPQPGFPAPPRLERV